MSPMARYSGCSSMTSRSTFATANSAHTSSCRRAGTPGPPCWMDKLRAGRATLVLRTCLGNRDNSQCGPADRQRTAGARSAAAHAEIHRIRLVRDAVAPAVRHRVEGALAAAVQAGWSGLAAERPDSLGAFMARCDLESGAAESRRP